MTMSTRTDPPTVLEHILVHVLTATEADSPYRKVFAHEGIESVHDLLALDPRDYPNLCYEEGGTTHTLKRGMYNRLTSVTKWFGTQGTTDPDVFYQLDAKGLREFISEQAATALGTPSFAPPATPRSGSSSAALPSYSTLSPADEFRRSIKRDVNAFPTFKDRKNWNVWHRSFVATAASQGLSNVLDADYSPSNASEQAFFQVIQDFTFAVFTLHLRESESSEIVHRYSGESVPSDKRGNAQLLYQELVLAMEGGMAGSTRRTTIEKRLQNLRLDQRWNGSILSFITTVSHSIQDLRDLRSAKDKESYGDSWCIHTLSTCLSTHTQMSAYIQTEEASSRSK